MAKNKKPKSKPKAPAKGSKGKSKGGSSKAKSSSKPKSALLPVLAGAAVVGIGVFLLWPRQASAATLPQNTGTPRTRPTPVRTATTRAKPQMASALRTQVLALAESPLYFWIQGAVSTLNPQTPAPTADRMQSMNETRAYDPTTAAGLRRLGSSSVSGTRVNYDDFVMLNDMMRGRRVNLPYQVPTDVWSRVQQVLTDVMNAPEDASNDEPE